MNSMQKDETMTLMPKITEETCAHELYRELARVYPAPGLAGAFARAEGPSGEAFFGELLGLRSKEDYLEFRDQMKAYLRFYAASQKRLRKSTRVPGGDALASSRLHQHAGLITRLIEIRRAGKAWSRARVEAARAAAVA